MYEYRKLSSQQKAELVQKRLNQGFPPHSPPHPIQNESFYLITVACFNHENRLNTAQRRQQILNQIFEIFINKEVQILAWIILPNHYHLLTETVDFQWLSKELRLIHGRSARQWNLEDNISGKVWCSYSDRAIRSERHYFTTLNYIHFNPVKHNWVKSPYDWQESSIHWYFQNQGKDWLRRCWLEYPLRNYGKNWDD